MTRQQRIEEAKYCIETMKRIGTYRGHKIGIITQDASMTLTKGRITLYKEEDDTLTTEYACDKEWIERNLKNGNFIMTHLTCVCVPKYMVSSLTNKFEFINRKN
jgi:hypothetical protein